MKLFATSLLDATLGVVLALTSVSSFAADAAKPEPAKAKPVAYKPDLAKGQASFAVCSSCHGVDGNSGTPAYPKLAQQHPEYLVKQLQEYKSGKRANAIMVGFATGLSEEDMKNIAFWVTTNKAKPGTATDKDMATLGGPQKKGRNF